MTRDELAAALSEWAGELAPATRDQLSTYDLRALFDELERAADVSRAVRHWVGELAPATRGTLSAFDLRGLLTRVGPPGRRPGTVARVDPTGLGPPSRPDLARARGFTGDPCSSCGGFAVIWSGTCTTCQDCGAQTGCS